MGRARPHQAHVPGDHVDELGQFIQARAADEAAEGRHAGIVAQLVVHGPLAARRRIDGQQLVQAGLRLRHH